MVFLKGRFQLKKQPAARDATELKTMRQQAKYNAKSKKKAMKRIDPGRDVLTEDNLVPSGREITTALDRSLKSDRIVYVVSPKGDVFGYAAYGKWYMDPKVHYKSLKKRLKREDKKAESDKISRKKILIQSDGDDPFTKMEGVFAAEAILYCSKNGKNKVIDQSRTYDIDVKKGTGTVTTLVPHPEDAKSQIARPRKHPLVEKKRHFTFTVEEK